MAYSFPKKKPTTRGRVNHPRFAGIPNRTDRRASVLVAAVAESADFIGCPPVATV